MGIRNALVAKEWNTELLFQIFVKTRNLVEETLKKLVILRGSSFAVTFGDWLLVNKWFTLNSK